MSERRKVAIIGDGMVGSSIAFSLTMSSLVNEIVIIDINKAKAEGDALDLNHGMSLSSPKVIKAGEYEDIKGAKVVILACGVSQREGETRLELLGRNKAIFDSVIENMRPYLEKDVVILVVSNPVDILSYHVYKTLGLPANQVIGSGTVLDTARFKYLLAEDTGIDPRNIHAYVIGEHGDSEVAAFSVTSIAGLPIFEYCRKCNKCTLAGREKNLLHMQDEVRNSAYEIIKRKGSTYYGIALATSKILEAIFNDTNSVLTVSTYIEEAFDGRIKDVYLSLPVIVNSKGAVRRIDPKYSESEIALLIESANTLKETNK